MTGEIDFPYIPSEWDVVEKVSSPKDVTEMAISRDRRRKDKKFLRDQTARKDDKRKDSSSLNPKKEKGRNHFTRK